MNVFYTLLAASAAFSLGWIVCALLASKDPNQASESKEISQVDARLIGEALEHAGGMLKSGEFIVFKGDFEVKDMGFGMLGINGDLQLQAIVKPKTERAHIGRSFIGK